MVTDTLTESPRGSCVCVKSQREIPRVAVGVSRKPHDGGVCAVEHTAAAAAVAVAVAVVVVVVGSKMGSNYYPKGRQIPVLGSNSGVVR